MIRAAIARAHARFSCEAPKNIEQIDVRAQVDRHLLFRRAAPAQSRRATSGHQVVAEKIPKRIVTATAPSIREPTLFEAMNVALGVIVLLTSFVAGTEPRDGSHVRTMDKRLQSAIDEGLARSAFFRSLVTRLDESDVIVYVEPQCPMSSRLFGRLTFLAAGGDRRYVSVRISCVLTVSQQIAALGHELRHAVEIADAPSVVDDASLAAEYRRVGFASRALRTGKGFESGAAIDAARQVWAELARTAE